MRRKIKFIIYFVMGVFAASALINVAIFLFVKNSFSKIPQPIMAPKCMTFTTDKTSPMPVSGYDWLLPFQIADRTEILSFDKGENKYRLFIDPQKNTITIEENYKRVLEESKEPLQPFIKKLKELATKEKVMTHYMTSEDLSLSVHLENITLTVQFTDFQLIPTDENGAIGHAIGYLLVK